VPVRPDDLRDMAVFAAVARVGSYTGAARDLGLSKSAASKAVARLEERLATRLLQRTTRHVALTEAGRTLETRVAKMLEEASAGTEAVAALASRPMGTLRVNGPVTFGQLLISPVLPDLVATHPGLRVDLTLDDRLVDPGAGGWDVVVRIAAPTESSLIFRKLAPDRRVVVGSPAYCQRRGTPRTPDDLGDHDCLHYTNVSRAEEWRFRGARGAVSVATSGSLEANHGLVLRAAALAGVGIAVLPEFMVAEDLKTGRVIELLREHALPPRSAIHALYPRARLVPPKVKVFLDLLAKGLRAAGISGASGS